MHRHLLAVALLAIVALPACPREPQFPPATDDDVDAPPSGQELRDAAARACAGLARVGCPEGSSPRCVDALVSGTELRRARGGFPLACWSVAADRVAALSCGSLRCIR